MPQDEVYVCPQCQSPALDLGNIGDDVRCRKCGWGGKVKDTIAAPFQNPFSSQQQATEQFVKDIGMWVVETGAIELGRVLIKWGFMDRKNPDPKVLGRYATAIAKAVAIAILREREAIEVGPKAPDGEETY